MTYIITVTLTGGDQVVATVGAESSSLALSRLLATPEAQRFIGSAAIERVECREVEKPSTTQPTYIVQPSRTEGMAVVTDTTHNVTVTFKIGRFNTTQKMTALDDRYSAKQLAHYARLLADWLQANRLDLVTTDADALRSWRLLKVGQTIAEARKAQGLTQQELANLADLPPNSLAKIERGETNSSTAILGKIAAALGIELGIK